jgi:hypothetical protein
MNGTYGDRGLPREWDILAGQIDAERQFFAASRLRAGRIRTVELLKEKFTAFFADRYPSFSFA